MNYRVNIPKSFIDFTKSEWKLLPKFQSFCQSGIVSANHINGNIDGHSYSIWRFCIDFEDDAEAILFTIKFSEELI